MHKINGIWPEFTERYEAAKASIETYHQKYMVFIKWLDTRNLEAERTGAPPILDMEDLTREVAEDYARYIYKRKYTARKDIESLRRLWEVMLPDQDRNPWRIGLHLRPALPPRPCNYRPLTVDEARRFIPATRRCAEMSNDASPIHDPRFTAGADKFLDLADAAVFAWHYGMRMGSLASLNWRELSTWRRGFFLHVPPKTRYTKPWPLEIPVVGEVREVLEERSELARAAAVAASAAPDAAASGERRSRRATPTGPVFPALAAEYRRSAANLAASVKGVFKAAGIGDTAKGRAQMHSFRASFITQMDEAGAPSGVTDSITGHAPKSIHDRYSHARTPALRRWLDRAIPAIGA
ncbi:MAG: tyrosine-type recombinase/integrase [Kiritimatiellae bacterium]|nr:tyrosine-type recombinase/integrase [Kiritimatiellia bacterium]